MKTIKVGFLGAGNVADIHAEAVNSMKNAELVGLWNRSPDQAKIKAEKYGCKIYESEEELLSDPEIDAVFILTNMETHCDYTIRAARKGKHVLVEKPAGSNISELENMLKVVKETGVICMPVHNYIYDSGLQRTHEMIQNGSLGELVQFYMLYNVHHADSVRGRYPGVIRQILTHHVYTMLYLVGYPEVVSCFKHTTDSSIAPQENVAMANLKMRNGALSHLSASFANDDQSGDTWTLMVKVIGTKGSTRYSFRDWVINERYGPLSQTFYAYPDSIKNTAKHFINNVISNGEKPLSDLNDAISCQRIVEAFEKSVKEGVYVSV